MARYTNLSSRDIVGTFWEAYEESMAKGMVESLAMRFESDKEIETYGWLGSTPAMREWIGGRLAQGLRENTFTIRNKTFEATLEVLVDDIRRDKTEQILTRVRELGDRAAEHPDMLLSTVILNGESALCYDGQYFFDTDHSEGDSGTQSNDISVDISTLAVEKHGSTTEPSDEEFAKAVLLSIKQLYGLKDDQGQPVNGGARKFAILVPVSFLDVALAATSNSAFASGRENTLLKAGYSLGVIPDPRNTWSDKFMVARTDGRTKAFIHQVELETDMKAIAEGSELEFNTNTHHYGVKAIRNVGYGDWKKAVLATLV